MPYAYFLKPLTNFPPCMFKLPRTNLQCVDISLLDTYCYKPPWSSTTINMYPHWDPWYSMNFNLSLYIRVSGSNPEMCGKKYEFFIVYIICLKILIHAGAGVLSVSSYSPLNNFCNIFTLPVFPYLLSPFYSGFLRIWSNSRWHLTEIQLRE